MVDTFGHKIGDLDFFDWDKAIARGIGAVEDKVKKEWFIPLDMVVRRPGEADVPVPRALVVFKRPEPTNINFQLPEITIIRDNAVPAPNRLSSQGNAQYRIPAPGAVRVSAGGRLGWSAYEMKPKADPYDLTYTIECWTRSRSLSQILLQIVMAKYPQRGTVTVTDSIKNDGVYAVYQQGTADLTQLGSMVDRVPAFSVSIKVEAELTLGQRSFTVAAFTGATSSSPIPGINDSASGNGQSGDSSVAGDDTPNPGSGGLYGTGLPIIRVGIVEDD